MAGPYATEADAREAYAGVQGAPARLRAVMVLAAGMVARIAPPPDEALAPDLIAEYGSLAADAELIAGQYFWETGGYLKSDSVSNASATYGTSQGVEDAIAVVMNGYVPAGAASGESGKAYDVEIQSTFPAAVTFLPFNVNDPYE